MKNYTVLEEHSCNCHIPTSDMVIIEQTLRKRLPVLLAVKIVLYKLKTRKTTSLSSLQDTQLPILSLNLSAWPHLAIGGCTTVMLWTHSHTQDSKLSSCWWTFAARFAIQYRTYMLAILHYCSYPLCKLVSLNLLILVIRFYVLPIANTAKQKFPTLLRSISNLSLEFCCKTGSAVTPVFRCTGTELFPSIISVVLLQSLPWVNTHQWFETAETQSPRRANSNSIFLDFLEHKSDQ